ncbi:hypothetical protein WME73_47870 [Sorangium sp. So ce302]|uniref:hypothetical protein n=1 Tax=Sorangium sp. So ce302 TaxID=3133297 RepID=UPI003F5FB185
MNPGSLVFLSGCQVEPSLSTVEKGSHVRFEREGFFFVDPLDSAPGAPVFNRTAALKDSWSRLSVEKPARARGPAPREPGREGAAAGASARARALRGAPRAARPGAGRGGQTPHRTTWDTGR